MLKVILWSFTLLLSLNCWSASTQERKATLNFLPSGKCEFKTNPLKVPGSDLRFRSFEVFTTRRGTGCMVGQKNNFWDKCDLRDGESDSGSEPQSSLILKYRTDYNGSQKRDDMIMVPMITTTERQATFDRLGNAIGLYETVIRENVEIEGFVFNLVTKRQIPKLTENKIITELQVFIPGNKEKKTRSKLVVRGRCESEFTQKSY